MVELKAIKSNLKHLGYTHSWKLIKDHNVTDILAEFEQEANSGIQSESTKMSLCQTIDLIVPEKERSFDQERQLQQFLVIAGSSFGDDNMGSIDGGYDSDSTDPFSKIPKDLSTPLDTELRECRINEFIDTEQSYVDSLNTMVDIVLKPLKSLPFNQAILNQFKLSKIFLNLESILVANQKFLVDLESWQTGEASLSFGAICTNHMANFECYRKYLMDQKEAQKLHVKEVKSNPRYKRFLTTAKEHPGFRRRSLQDILVEPVQRIGRYTMMLKEILKHTNPETQEYEDLTNACTISSRIATMKDDVPTRLATMSLSLYTSIKDSPCSLISQHRSLVAHLDAVEIHKDTNKPFRSVTFFLFTDKLLVATRPSHLKGSDLCHVLKDEGLSAPKPAIPKTSDKPTRKDGSLKFKAWADIGQIELFEGVQDLPGSFSLHSQSPQLKENVPFSTLTSLEAYFHKGTRLYTPISPKDHNQTPENIKAIIQRKDNFLTAYQKVQAISKSCHEQRVAYEASWAGRNIYTTLHDPDSYNSAKYKSQIVLVYVDGDDVLDIGFLSSNSGIEPLVVALVQADVRGFRFHVSSKIRLSPVHKTTNVSASQGVNEKKEGKPADFESVFWNNMVLCGQRLRYVSESYDVQESLTDDESQKLVRSRSFTRPNSILGLRKLLSYGDIRSRTSPPLPSATSEKGSQTTSSQGNTHQDGLDIHGAKTNNGEHNQQIQDPPIISRSLPSRIPSMSLIDAHFCDTEAHGRSISTSPPLSTPFIQYSAPPERSNYSQDTWTTGETKYLGSYSPKSNGYAETNQCNRDTDSTKQDDLLSFLLQKHHPGDKNFISTETERWPTYHYNNAVSLGDSASRPHSSIPAMVSPSSSYRSNVPELFNTLSSNSSGQSVKSSIDLYEDELEEENYQPLYAPSAMAELNLVDLKDNDSGISRKVHELLASSRSRSVITQPIPGQFGTHSSQTDASTVSVFDQVTMDKFEMLVDKQNILKTHVDRLGKLHPEVEDELKILKDIHKQVFNEMDLLLNLMQVQCKMPRATIQDLETNEKHYTAEPLDFNKKILDMQFNDTLVKQEKTQHDYWEHHARELSFRFEN